MSPAAADTPQLDVGWRASTAIVNVVVCVALIGMTTVPLAEIVMRRLAGTGIKGASTIVQQLCLIVGMSGAVIAARRDRLLSLSTFGHGLNGRVAQLMHIFSSSVAVAITALLCAAGATYMMAERAAGEVLVYGIPVWVVQFALPAGFALIGTYILLLSADRWIPRFAVLAAAGALIVIGGTTPNPETLLFFALFALAAATVLGVPVFVTLGGLAVILFWDLQQPIATIAIDHYALVTDPSLPTIPLFTLAGYALAKSGAPRRLVRVFRAVLGHFAGSSVIAAVLLCAFFTTFTGASGITILAIGGLLMPVLLSDGYQDKHALGLVTSAGSLGLLFPPCLPLIVYAVIAKVPLDKMFLGGILPGIVMLIATATWGLSHRTSRKESSAPFQWNEVATSLWDAKWELMLPVVALASLFSGVATPVESAAVTALYALVIETCIYRDLKLKEDLPNVFVETGLLVGGVLLILGVALGFTDYLVNIDFTAHAVDWIVATIESPLVFLLVLNIWLLIVGCLMDIYSAIIIQVPLLVPLALRFNIDPIHLGIIFLANLEVGYLTPPVGLNLFMSSTRFRKPLNEVVRATLPVAIVLFIAVLVITYVPILSTALPSRFSR